MDFDRLERAWASPANSPSEAAAAYVTDALFDTLRRRRRATARFLRFVGMVLVFWTAVVVFQVLTDPFPFDFAREWSLLLLGALPWIGLFLIRRQQRRHLLAHPDPYQSVAASLCGLLDENLAARRRLGVTTGLMAAGLVLLALALGQLETVGKMTPDNVRQAAILFGAILAAVAGYKAWHYARVLKPEGERLRRLLADYGG
jgi:hypothetical protein